MPEMMKSDDADLEGAPPDSIESLYAAQESALLCYAQSLVRQNETAQDIVQEAFMRLHADFATVRQPQAWLYRTVHNLALNHLRAGRKIVPMTEDELSAAAPTGPIRGTTGTGTGATTRSGHPTDGSGGVRMIFAVRIISVRDTAEPTVTPERPG